MLDIPGVKDIKINKLSVIREFAGSNKKRQKYITETMYKHSVGDLHRILWEY